MYTKITMNNNNNGEILIVVISCLYIIMCCSAISSMSTSLGISFGMRGDGGASSTWEKTPKVVPGPWTSSDYGTMKDGTTMSMCPEGSYVSNAMVFYGQKDHTNAIQAWCWNPSTKQTARIFDSPTCGKRDRPDAGAILKFAFLDIFLQVAAVTASIALTVFFPPAGAAMWALTGAMIAGTVGTTVVTTAMTAAAYADAKEKLLKPGVGRKLWDYEFFDAPAGINSWMVRPKDGEIKGLKFFGLGGEEMKWAGGGSNVSSGSYGPRKTDPSGTITKGTCPKGKIVRGIKASCGDRVDGLAFLCDVPPGF